MFESAELGHQVSKEVYQQEVPPLRESLLDVQFELHEHKSFTVLIIIAGVDGAGKGETVNLLNTWMDPRLIETMAFDKPTKQERRMPRLWRYWQHMPAKGKIGIIFGSWYTDIITARASGSLTNGEYDRLIAEIVNFEKMLSNEGVLVLKYWFHLSKDKQKRRLQKLESDPLTSWRVSGADWEKFKHYDDYRSAAEHCLRLSSTGENPWIIVEGEDEYYRNLTIGRHIRDNLQKRLEHRHSRERRTEAPPLILPVDNMNVLRALALDQALDKTLYREKLEKLQGRLNSLAHQIRLKQKASIIILFEGSDAAGKGGCIRRITEALDARQYHIIPVAAPNDEERARPYLWRFWRQIPPYGRLTIFDRSWYGRVLVERVEGYCSDADWMRAYDEINQFEHQLAESHIFLVKFWLAVSKEEQLQRFKSRENTGFKRFKITPEDWRNRDKWDTYEEAVNDMVDRTSTQIAPWTLVEANDKYYARIKVLKTLCDELEKHEGR